MTGATFPKDAGAVVIGAGAFGFNVAFQLANLGARRVVLLDQFEPATQVSPRAAGLFKSVQSTEVYSRIAQLAMSIVRGFEAETGVAMPHVNSGSLLVARTPEHGAMIDADIDDANGWGIETHRIDGAEAHRLAPFLAGDRLRGAYHVPGDLYIEEPKSLLLALRDAGARKGMQTIGHTRVTGIAVERDVVTGVVTERGSIRTPLVVDAAGVWSRALGRLAGVEVMVQPIQHQLRITNPIAGITPEQPIVRMPDAAAYVRPARGGLMVGGFEADPLPIEAAAIPGYHMDLVPFDAEIADSFAAAMTPDIEALRTATAQEERALARSLLPPIPLRRSPLARGQEPIRELLHTLREGLEMRDEDLERTALKIVR
jgi:glycine/D-amino acid oxidase-like deaminating enzyme